MVRKGDFERHNFDTLLRSVAEEVKTQDSNGNIVSRWYLLETAGEVDAAESGKEDAVARRLEEFMVKFLSDHPEFEGVHYSDLFEQYLPVQDKPRRMLADWLPEFFYRTSEGTWRPPMDGDERQQKQHLRTNGTLRRIKRFTNAILNSVPPADRDRAENAATLANWINECRKAGLYDQGKLLYEQGGLSFNALSEKAQLEVKENYLICTRRTRKDDDKQISLY
jgi:DNA replication protein DnaC